MIANTLRKFYHFLKKIRKKKNISNDMCNYFITTIDFGV